MALKGLVRLGARRSFGKGCYVWDVTDGVVVVDAECELVWKVDGNMDGCTMERRAIQAATVNVEITLGRHFVADPFAGG